jgi:ankyrin repeat protein
LENQGGIMTQFQVDSELVLVANSQVQATIGKLQNEIEIVNQFINSFDFDQTTPLIFALKNQRKNVIKILLENQKTCLTMRNLRFGSPLHVAFNNLDYKSAIIILNSIIKNQKVLSNSIEAFNYQDEEGNTPLHLVMKNFNIESEKS